MDLKDIQIPQGQDLIDAILKLKKKKCRDFGALLSARRNSRYCRLFGDSLQLARAAKIQMQI